MKAADGIAGIANPGAHGFSEILYAFTSAANNNGSAFAGLSANTPFYNVMLGIAMWFGRFGVIVPVLAIAGSLAAKKRIAVTAGTMPTHGPLFVVLLIGTVVLVGALNYVPALALGPLLDGIGRLPARAGTAPAAPRCEPDRARLAAEIAELERLLSKNSLDAKRQFARLRGALPPGGFQEELKALEGCMERLDFKKARTLLAQLSGRVGEPAHQGREPL